MQDKLCIFCSSMAIILNLKISKSVILLKYLRIYFYFLLLSCLLKLHSLETLKG